MSLIPPYDTAAFLKAANDPAFVLPENERRIRTKPRASGLMSCARQQVYEMLAVPYTDIMKEDAVITQELGRMSEDYTTRVVPKIDSPLVELPWESLAVVDRQVSLPEDYFVTGHPDGRLTQRKFFYPNAPEEGGRRNVYADTTADGLRWGWEHKLYGAYSYKEALLGNAVTGTAGAFGQGLIYGDALGWDAVLIHVMAADAALVRGEMTHALKYAKTGKSPETRRVNQEKVDKFRGKNPKVEVKHVDLRPYKDAFIPDFRARAEALTETVEIGCDPDTVRRERDPDQHPLCGYCPFKTRCVEAGQGSLIVPESPIDD
jgi:hypothetical protein